jgi:hypothetical protein
VDLVAGGLADTTGGLAAVGELLLAREPRGGEMGQAKENGALGQTITVINQDSKKAISAKVIGPGQVEVVF